MYHAKVVSMAEQMKWPAGSLGALEWWMFNTASWVVKQGSRLQKLGQLTWCSP